jgi:hypothetical protein
LKKQITRKTEPAFVWDFPVEQRRHGSGGDRTPLHPTKRRHNIRKLFLQINRNFNQQVGLHIDHGLATERTASGPGSNHVLVQCSTLCKICKAMTNPNCD